MRYIRRGIAPLPWHESSWVDCLVNSKRLRESSLFEAAHAYKKKNVYLGE
jgi:hypothetical protein